MLWLSLDLWKCFWISSNFQNNPCDPAGGLLSFYTQVWLVSLLVPILEFLWLWSRYFLIHDIPLYFRRNGDSDVQAMLWPTMHLLGTQLTMFVWASCLEKCLPACHEGLLGLSHSRIRTGSSYYPLPCFLASSTLCHYTYSRVSVACVRPISSLLRCFSTTFFSLLRTVCGAFSVPFHSANTRVRVSIDFNDTQRRTASVECIYHTWRVGTSGRPSGKMSHCLAVHHVRFANCCGQWRHVGLEYVREGRLPLHTYWRIHVFRKFFIRCTTRWMWPASSNRLGLVQRRRARAEQTLHMALQLCLQRLALFLVSPVLHDAADNKKKFRSVWVAHAQSSWGKM